MTTLEGHDSTPSRGRRVVVLLVGTGLVVVALLTYGGSRVLDRRARDVPRPPLAPVTRLVTIFGAPSTFGPTLKTNGAPDPEPLAVGIEGWRFEPGASAAFATISPSGRTLIGTFPQTDNQVKPTMDSMSVAVFDPAGPAMWSLRIPTDAGNESATANGARSGGADVSDLCPVTTPDGDRTVAVSSVPDKLWDPAKGVFPSLTFLADDASRGGDVAVSVDERRTRGARDLIRSGAGGALIRQFENPERPGLLGLTECDPVPNGDLIITQYFPPADGSSGGLAAVDSSGGVVAAHRIEPVILTDDLAITDGSGHVVTVPRGATVTASPREVRADPHTREVADQRFTVVFDLFGSAGDAHVNLPFGLREYRYDATRHTITPTSPLLVSEDARRPDRAGTDLMQAATVVYAPDGTLFVARTHAQSALSAPTAVYRAGSLSTRPTRPSALGAIAEPDATIDGFDAYAPPAGQAPPAGGRADFALTLSIDFDADRHTLVQVSANSATLRAARWKGLDAATAAPPVCELDTGGRVVAEAQPGYRYQSRQGAIDPRRNVLYVPYQGLQKTDPPAELEVVPQYLFQIDLVRLQSFCAFPKD